MPLTRMCSVVCQSYKKIISDGKQIRKRRSVNPFHDTLGSFAERQIIIMGKNIKIVGILVMVYAMLFTCASCGTSDKIVGTYQGTDGAGILSINDDDTWSYVQEGDWGSDDTDWNGTYSKDKETYLLECDDIILYAEVTSDDILYVHSNSSSWGSEDFRKID